RRRRMHLRGQFTEAAMTLSEPDDPTLSRIAAGRTDLVFDHVGAGHAATARDGDGLSLLYWCARYGDVSAMRFLLAHGEQLDSIA
ncbi:MAG: hypothetical protein ABIU76_01835, partial [Gemmatimonadaceae bacterium]